MVGGSQRRVHSIYQRARSAALAADEEPSQGRWRRSNCRRDPSPLAPSREEDEQVTPGDREEEEDVSQGDDEVQHGDEEVEDEAAGGGSLPLATRVSTCEVPRASLSDRYPRPVIRPDGER
jgi:hypothetical protein